MFELFYMSFGEVTVEPGMYWGYSVYEEVIYKCSNLPTINISTVDKLTEDLQTVYWQVLFTYTEALFY